MAKRFDLRCARRARRCHPNTHSGTSTKRAEITSYSLPRRLSTQPSALSAVVADEDYFTGSSRAPASGKEFQPRSAIQGFEFYFDNKAHHIRELGVMPRLPGSAVSSRAPAGEYIAFQDTNRDDPIKWAVKLLTIKP